MLDTLEQYSTVELSEVRNWFKVAPVEDFPVNGGACVKYNDLQIAVFNFSRENKWFATQNLCPHKRQMILSRGLTGSQDNEPKVACPYHKKTFSLETGENLNGNECRLATYPVKVENGYVFIGFAS